VFSFPLDEKETKNLVSKKLQVQEIDLASRITLLRPARIKKSRWIILLLLDFLSQSNSESG
jgi:hypothetical protein